jgi:hypothetical protein
MGVSLLKNKGDSKTARLVSCVHSSYVAEIANDVSPI